MEDKKGARHFLPRCTYCALPSVRSVCRRRTTKVDPMACSSLLLALTPSDQSASTTRGAAAAVLIPLATKERGARGAVTRGKVCYSTHQS